MNRQTVWNFTQLWRFSGVLLLIGTLTWLGATLGLYAGYCFYTEQQFRITWPHP